MCAVFRKVDLGGQHYTEFSSSQYITGAEHKTGLNLLMIMTDFI